MSSERQSAPKRNLPAKRCGLYQQVLSRRDVEDGDYTDGFRSFYVVVEGAKRVPEHVAFEARRLGLEATRPEPDTWLFAEGGSG